MGQAKPQMIMKSLVPVVMASIVGIYGLVVAILIGSAVTAGPEYNLHSASIHLASGLATGFGGLASGWTIGVVGDAGVRCLAQQTRIFVAMVLILIFAEVLGNTLVYPLLNVLGLYGLIVALILNSKTSIGASCT
jgi:V-type H+-transporting ATPase proteolipid subunit